MRTNNDRISVTEDDEEETLNTAAECFECRAPVYVTIATPLGIGGHDMTTPVFLCGTDCVRRNLERLARMWSRCTCGAIISPTDLLTHRRGEIIGCPACEQTGEPQTSTVVTHFWTMIGGPACAPHEKPVGHMCLTIRKRLTTCAGCIHAIIVSSELRRRGQAVIS